MGPGDHLRADQRILPCKDFRIDCLQAVPAHIVISISCARFEVHRGHPLILHRPQYLPLIFLQDLFNTGELTCKRLFSLLTETNSLLVNAHIEQTLSLTPEIHLNYS